MYRFIARFAAALGLTLVFPFPATATPFEAGAGQLHTHIVEDAEAAYTIHVGGTADMDNTATRRHETWDIAFQNNRTLTLANTGDVPVVNPRIITNGQRNWHSVESMIAEFTAGARNRQEAVYLIWEGVRQNRHHDSPLFGSDYHDPVRLLNIYGGALCDDSAATGAALYHTAGFNEAAGGKNPFQRGLHGHVMCEVWHDGAYQFMDIDQDVFFLDRENRKPVSGDTLARDHGLARRELAYGPVFQGWERPAVNAALFGADDVRTKYWSTGHTMDYTLRPGERIVFHWNRTGKWAWNLHSAEHRYYGNSELVYPVPASENRLDGSGVTLSGMAPGEDGFAVTADDASMTIPTNTAYTICGGTLSWTAGAGFPSGAEVAMALSLDGENFVEVHAATPEAGASVQVSLDEALGLQGGDPRRAYWVRISIRGGLGGTLRDIELHTDLYAYPIALPRLSVGENAVTYRDDTEGPHEVTVTYRWRESGNVTPPVPPEKPDAPGAGATVQATFVPFAWPAVADCDAYQLRVSRDPDLRFPYRPNFDQILPENQFEVPFRGMFSPGETYYWRVRPRLENGLWGDWSDTWTFTWTGPTVPQGVALDQDGEQRIVFRWAPNPSGNPPVRYRVYGSNERGFSIGNETIQAMHDGPELQSAETEATELLVGGREASGPLANRAFYRVVAIDADGVESCPSDYVELPRPYVYSTPVTEARAGEPYQYDVETVESFGDLQYRYEEPRADYWEKESYRYTLASGPSWLAIQEYTGVLQGTPPADTAGTFPVRVRVETVFADEVPPDARRAAAFRDPHEQRVYEHMFELAVMK